jgi:glycosyltransferase involved in cell wall biosynthesis
LSKTQKCSKYGPLTLGLTLLCENPSRLTGLSSLFKEFVGRSVRFDKELHWVVFVGRDYDFGSVPERVTFCRQYAGNNQLRARLYADHFLVSRQAERLNAKALLTVGFVPLRERVPTVMHLFTLHHLSAANRLNPFRSIYRRWSATRGLKAARLVITNSQYAASRITAALPMAENKMIQSYEGLDHTLFHPNRPGDEADQLQRALGVPTKYILWLSNLYPYKQADLLIQSYARIPRALREEYPLVFVGGDWFGQRTLLEQLAIKLSVAGQIRFLDWVGQHWIVPLLRQARILVLPSREETFGRSVAEAMACGTPCVVNDIPIMREVTQGAAWIVDYRNSDDVSRSLVEALTDEGRRADVIQRGLVRSRDFDFDKLTRERLAAIYTSLNLTEGLERLRHRNAGLL